MTNLRQASERILDSHVDHGNNIESVRVVGSLQIPPHDYIAVTYPTTTSEVFTYKSGGSGGSTVAVVTITYMDTTKEYISSVAKS